MTSNQTSALTSLNQRGFTYFEGYSEQVPAQQSDLRYYASQPHVKRILEIGFNAGHSADLFLSSNANASLVSFDLGDHPYVLAGKDYIDTTYPSRHTLALGDSLTTVQAYHDAYPDTKFDLIFIDRNHNYTWALNDILNCKKLAYSDTTLIVDDTMFIPEWIANWTTGPSKAWTDALQKGWIKEKVRSAYLPGRGQSVGNYML